MEPSGSTVSGWQPRQPGRSAGTSGWPVETAGGSPWHPLHCRPVADQAGDGDAPWHAVAQVPVTGS